MNAFQKTHVPSFNPLDFAEMCLQVPALETYSESDIEIYIHILKDIFASGYTARVVLAKYPLLFVTPISDIKENWQLLTEKLKFSDIDAIIVAEEQPYILTQNPEEFSRKIDEMLIKKRFLSAVRSDIMEHNWDGGEEELLYG